MAQGQQTNRALVRGAERALDQFKYQVAQQIGVQVPQDGYWGDLPSRVTGAVGGNMVRQMIQLAEQQLAGGATPPAGVTPPAFGAAQRQQPTR